MQLDIRIDNLQPGKNTVICRGDVTICLKKQNGDHIDIVTVKECGLCPSKRGGYALLSPSRKWETSEGETKYFSHVSWPQKSYDAVTNALMCAATEAGLMGSPSDPPIRVGLLEPEGPVYGDRGPVTREKLVSAGLVEDTDPLDPFAE